MTATDPSADSQEARRFRTLFLSDLHLGTRGLQAELLLDFLRHHDAETIYLVGDIVDGWRLKNGWYWPQSHNDVVQKLLRKARKGARVIYVPGNHDEFARDYAGMVFGGVEVTETDVHETADGKKMLVIHGDQFDIVVRHARWLAFLGDWAYELALFLNIWNNRIRRLFGVGYWSFSAWAKLKVKKAVNFIGDFEETLAAEAARRGVDGVVCGHIHHATIRRIGDMLYVNTGDFVESCTAVAEHSDGRFEILHWRTTAQERVAAAQEDTGAAAPARAAA
ncbi:UDP-2,3-diacylglucosamine diphosphatase [Methylosinus sp. Sm6]|uniref:UDP-2,3-diacylglucosamine diphosphatase n=1 Tax=Methylosinus sp. Sm6 TaxID=2866948 RepID=UPI001C997A8E|nr:UDP-2,3-diacylglucosamine diphosphatase [Methylosinus sp. Sm6]MBY6240710.1 UDP-2,3-diacylglucosamine diphosphatase [Methylosinus sp. Sm6]